MSSINFSSLNPTLQAALARAKVLKDNQSSASQKADISNLISTPITQSPFTSPKAKTQMSTVVTVRKVSNIYHYWILFDDI